MNRKSPLWTALAVSALLGINPGAPGQQPPADGWRPFKATWTLSGQREAIETEGQRRASIVHVTGPLTITSGEGIGRGFLGEVIGFDDGERLLVGRATLTDERGDRIFCTLQAEPIGSSRLASATIAGGTGRFAGLQGGFSFAWQYVVDAGGGEVSLRSVNVEGRTRGAASSLAPGARR